MCNAFLAHIKSDAMHGAGAVRSATLYFSYFRRHLHTCPPPSKCMPPATLPTPCCAVGPAAATMPCCAARLRSARAIAVLLQPEVACVYACAEGALSGYARLACFGGGCLDKRVCKEVAVHESFMCYVSAACVRDHALTCSASSSTLARAQHARATVNTLGLQFLAQAMLAASGSRGQ
jgi:hypothetical protein